MTNKSKETLAYKQASDLFAWEITENVKAIAITVGS